MVWLIGKGDTVFRLPGLEPSIPSSSNHCNHGAPWEVARDNILYQKLIIQSSYFFPVVWMYNKMHHFRSDLSLHRLLKHNSSHSLWEARLFGVINLWPMKNAVTLSATQNWDTHYILQNKVSDQNMFVTRRGRASRTEWQYIGKLALSIMISLAGAHTLE